MAELIFVNSDGKETRREVKGRGRPPKGSVKQDDGNFIVHPVIEERQVVEYIDVSEGGDVLNRELRTIIGDRLDIMGDDRSGVAVLVGRRDEHAAPWRHNLVKARERNIHSPASLLDSS